MSVNSENHVLGLWIGGGVTPAALGHIAAALDLYRHTRNQMTIPVVTEFNNIVNACHAQLSKLPKPDPTRYL